MENKMGIFSDVMLALNIMGVLQSLVVIVAWCIVHFNAIVNGLTEMQNPKSRHGSWDLTIISILSVIYGVLVAIFGLAFSGNGVITGFAAANIPMAGLITVAAILRPLRLVGLKPSDAEKQRRALEKVSQDMWCGHPNMFQAMFGLGATAA